MYFGVDYYPEQWVYPYAGTKDNPEACWEQDAELMREAGFNVVRMGEFTWALCEPEEDKYDFTWLQRVMDRLGSVGIKVILATPTAAPPLWLTKKYPEILPIDRDGHRKSEGTRRAVCLNSEAYWEHSKKLVTAMAKALGSHPQLIGWQIDNSIGGNFTEESFNEDTRRDWHLWLQAKYETIEKLNESMGTRHWGQIARSWDEVPMPMKAPTAHNPALELDWCRFCSDTIVQFVRMQADILHELSPKRPVTTNLRPLIHRFDHFDLAEALDFISIESAAAIRAKSSETACEIDMLRSLKKTDIRTPDGESGFWVMEQKAGNVNWQDVNSVVRPGVLRMFAYQLISRGADAILFFRWRQPRFGTESFHGAVMGHHLRKDNRVFREVAQLGEEIKLLAPAIKGARVEPEVCILYSHDNDWSLRFAGQPNKNFNLREHLQLIYTALHDKNILVDFARPSEDLSRYKLVFAPSLHLLSAGEADRLKLFVQNGGTLVGTFNTGLVDNRHLAPDSGYPHNLTDLFGLEVTEFDQLPSGEENHLTFKGAFPTSHLHPARLWCDLIEPRECQVLATYAKDFYAGKPAMTMNTYGLGKAIYVGTLSHQHFYFDLVSWLRQICNLHPLLKVPDTIEVGMRQKEGTRVFFLLNHTNSPVRIQFYKPMHDYLTSQVVSGGYDIPPHGVLVLDEHPEPKAAATTVPAAVPA
ncbi:MAG: beta-galactosidase [Verrucomicrobia bacterium]|nr:MAG: beta-galactosidase [Verrucomicrobiota bacterium]